MSKPPSPDQKSLVGYTIGKCKLLRICGRGAMGTVYKGMHGGLDIEVAVKILPPHLANNSNLVERFLREAKLAARLNHINTVRVYDVGEESGYNYLVMEFIDGTDALELVKRFGPQKAAIVADIGAGAARALEHAHANDVIHRDIKPANLMLPNTGGVKVADFGLARALSSESGLTMTGAIMGTPDYMAPEQAQGEQVGALADIYSLGATLYHLFVGRPPFAGATPMAVALQHVTSRVVVPEEMVTDEASQKLTRIIHELTQKDPKKRPASLEEIGQRLKEVARTNRSTQKLLSEGATLYATAGVKLDAEAINKAKEEQAAEALDKGRVQSPHLDKLRKAAEKARGASGMHAALADKPAAPPKAPAAEMAELTGDMVREARAKARRSSGQIKALPADPGRAAQRTSNPSMSPHRETRPTSNSSSRRNRIVQNPELDDQAWQSYAAKSFPTFERKSIIDGSVPDEIVTERNASGIHSSAAGSSSVMDYKGTLAAPADSWQPPRRRKSGSGVSILVALVIIAGIAGAIWFFFLRGGGGDSGIEQGTHVAGLNLTKFQAHARGVGVSSIAPQRGGQSFYTGGEDGSVMRWLPGKDTPEASTKLSNGGITVLATRADGQRLVVGTSGGVVMLLDANSLGVTSGQELRVEGKVTSILPIGVSQLVVGDVHGRLTLKTGTKRVQIGNETAPVAAIVYRNGEIWACAGKTLARFKIESNELVEVSMHPDLGGEVYDMVAIDAGVFAIVGDKLTRVTPQGAIEGGVDIKFHLINATYDGTYLLAVAPTGALVIDPATLATVLSSPVERQDTVIAIGASPQPGRFYLGTRSGEVYQCTLN
ncbi:MAG: serine/threonine protein kinase [Planctomycetes bacterium]|nr:serine/threonine protein kinase [Planctomycetota bacterium]